MCDPQCVPLDDPRIEGIYTSAGGRLNNSFDDDNGVGLNSVFDFIPRLDGDYFISTEGGNGAGAYRLTVTKNSEDYDDFDDGQSTTANIRINSSSLGRIEKEGDQDAFMMSSLDAGKTYIVGMEGSPTQSGSLGDPTIEGIYFNNTQDNDVISQDLTRYADDIGGGANLNSLLTFTPSETGDYYVVASAFSGIGSYMMTLNEVETDDFNSHSSALIEEYLKDFEDDLDVNKAILDVALESGIFNEIEAIEAIEAFEKSKIIDDNGLTKIEGFAKDEEIGYAMVGENNTVTGVIEDPMDLDWFAIYLVEGQQYKVNLSSSANDPLSDTFLDGIYRRDGSFISGTRNDDIEFGVSNSGVTYAPPTTGVFYISVGGFSIETGSYDLSIV